MKKKINPPDFPFLGVNLSGGHTQIILVKAPFEMQLIGSTLDDAIGEAFDKCGKCMGMSYPAGPQIDKLARLGNPKKFSFPISKLKGSDVSYSGIKTAFTFFIQKERQKDPNFIIKNLNDLCASLQYTLTQIILYKIEKTALKYGLKQIVLGGGVSANYEIRKQLTKLSQINNWKLFLPPVHYTTDNAAMIGIAAFYKIKKEKYGMLSDEVMARLNF